MLYLNHSFGAFIRLLVSDRSSLAIFLLKAFVLLEFPSAGFVACPLGGTLAGQTSGKQRATEICIFFPEKNILYFNLSLK